MSLITAMKPPSRVALPADVQPSSARHPHLTLRSGRRQRSRQQRPFLAGDGTPGRRGSGVAAPLERGQGLFVGQDHAAVAVHDSDALVGTLHGVEQAALGRLPLRHLALHHGPQALAHRRERVEEGAEFVLAAPGHHAVELSLGDQARDVRGDSHLPHDATRQQPGHQAGQQQGSCQPRQVQPPVLGHRGPRTLPVGEPVPGGVVDQQVHLPVGSLDVAGKLAVLGRDRRRDLLLPRFVPGVHVGLGLGCGLRGACRLRPLGGDRQIFGERSSDLAEPHLDLGPRVLVGSLGIACRTDLHQGEIRRGGTGVVDRHQRTVVSLGDECAAMLDAVGSMEADDAGDRRHDQERDQDLAPDGPGQHECTRTRWLPRAGATYFVCRGCHVVENSFISCRSRYAARSAQAHSRRPLPAAARLLDGSGCASG